MPSAVSKSHVPAAMRIADLIAQTLPDNAQLPVKLASRRELAEQYSVSMPTVTGALKLLREKDLVYWVPGKGMYSGVSPTRGASDRCFTIGMFGWFGHVLRPRLNDADTYRLNLMSDLMNVGMTEACQLTLIPQEPGKAFDMTALGRFTFDGLIVKDLIDPEKTIRQLRERDVALITDSMKYREYGVGYVGHNNVAMVADMVKAFVDRGHQRIAVLTLETSTPQQKGMMRNEFYARLVKSGCIYDAKRYYRLLDWDLWQADHNSDVLFDFGYRHAAEMLSWEDRPTAFFAWTPQMADGIKQAAEEIGLSVPDDVSILTDAIDEEYSSYSTFVQQHEELARGLIRRLKQVVDDPLLCVKDDLSKSIVDKGTIANR